jgi:hypothetical protein
MIDDMWERVFVAAIGGFMSNPDGTIESAVRAARKAADIAEDVYLDRFYAIALAKKEGRDG